MQKLFINASAIAHEKLVNVLENKTGHGISTGNGVVTLDLHQMIVEIGTQLGLPPDALAKLPAKAGTVTLMKSDQLSAAQTGVQAVRMLSVWLLVAVLVLYGLAIYLARGARRATLRNAGIGLALVGLLVLVIRHLLGNYLVDSLASPGYQPATHRLYLIGTSILGQIGAAALLYGVIAALGAVFAGPSAPAVWLRQRLAPVLNERQGIVWGGVGFVYLLLILLGRHARPAHLVGHPAPRRPDRDRRLRPAAPDADRVPAGTAARAGTCRLGALTPRARAAAGAARGGRRSTTNEFVERAKKLAAT